MREKRQRKIRKKNTRIKTIMNQANIGEKVNPIGRVKDMKIELEK